MHTVVRHDGAGSTGAGARGPLWGVRSTDKAQSSTEPWSRGAATRAKLPLRAGLLITPAGCCSIDRTQRTLTPTQKQLAVTARSCPPAARSVSGAAGAAPAAPGGALRPMPPCMTTTGAGRINGQLRPVCDNRKAHGPPGLRRTSLIEKLLAGLRGRFNDVRRWRCAGVNASRL